MANTQVTTSPAAQFKAFLEKHKGTLKDALPKHMTADRMMRLSLTAFSQNKDLQECDPRSIFASIVMASQLGLEIGIQGQAYLIPYKGKATFVPGWKGLVDLVNRTGRASVWTGAVRVGDDFDYSLGDSPFVKHRPGDDDTAAITYVYAVGRVKGSEWPVIEVWSMTKVRNHLRHFNKVGAKHYALKDDNNFEMYARKVCLLQVLKYMPASVELNAAIVASHKSEAGEPFTIDGDFNVVPPDEASPSDVPADDAPIEEPKERTDHGMPYTAQDAGVDPHAATFDDSPLTEARRKLLVGLMENAGISTSDVEKSLGVKWADLKSGHFMAAKSFISNPV